MQDSDGVSTIRPTDYHNLLLKRDGSVLVVSFNRPDRLNAMNAQVHAELARVFSDIAEDPAVDAVVLTGAGDAFSVGADFDWIREQGEAQFDRSIFEARKIILDLLEVPQPIVAAVNGHAIGLGATLAILCDFSYAAANARIGDPHVVLGMVPGDGGCIAWPWLVGMARAKRYLMTGDPILAPEAAAIGLITEVVPTDGALPKALETAQRLARMPKLAVRGAKATLNKILRETANLTLDTSLALERRSLDSAEHREALARYLATRRERRSTQRCEGALKRRRH